MKTKLSLLFIILSTAAFSQSQWAPIGAEWYYSVPNVIGNPLHSYEKYISKRDTIIDGKQCKVIVSQNNLEIMYSEQNKVYYRFNNSFNLIYNFTAKIGDTVNFDFKSYKQNSIELDTTYTVKCVVEKIDTIYNNEIGLKKYQTAIIPREDLDFIVWDTKYIYSEKLGYEYDFMYSLPIPSLGFMHNLRCYNDNDINFITDWWAGQDKDCDYTLSTSTTENNLINEKLVFFPNPTSNFIAIKIPEQKKNENYRISIFNNIGKAVQTSTLHNEHQTIDLTGLPQGIYHISISTRELLYKPFKIIKL